MDDKKLHVMVNLVINESNWSYTDPRTSRDIDFVIPIEMFTGNAFSKMVMDAIKELDKEYPKAVQEWEERKAQENEGGE